MYRNQTARQHNFATIPRSDIPRSKFAMRQTRKQAFNASDLVPIMCEEVLPGDTWSHTEAIMARLATPIAPAVDDIDLETFYFFVPNRIVWPEWEDFITGANTSLNIPVIVPAVYGLSYDCLVGSVFDHMGIPPGVYAADALKVNALPIWGYFTIYNEWFRDQNLQDEWEWDPGWISAGSPSITQGSAPTRWDQMPLRANKRHDYFTSSLPWPQKGQPVTIPLGATAPVFTVGPEFTPLLFQAGPTPGNTQEITVNTLGQPANLRDPLAGGTPTVFADLANATAVTINSLRLAAISQKLLEQDARGGTRYVEQLIAHFGVRSPDYRLQRPEYLGGSKIPITVNPVAQTATYTAAPAATDSALGNLGAEMHASGHKRTFNYAATEHGYIIGIACIRATPTYQQGLRRHWKRTTRLDFWFPEFDGLGEQAVNTREIYQPLDNVTANDTWGYQERAAEYRYTPNEITGVLRSTAPQPLDWWHYSEEFSGEPALNAAFITDKTQETLARSLATAPSEQWSAQVIMDIQHDSTVARLMPAYGVPGIDRF